MTLTTVLVAGWTLVAAATIPFCLYVAYDAARDVQARRMTGINHGRETLARLLVVTSLLITLAFLIWFCLGLYVLFLRPSTPAPWQSIITPAGLMLAELVLAVAMIYKQQVRKRVYDSDVASEANRRKAEADLASQQRLDLTEATRELTIATQEATAAIQNGPMAAQIAQTEATTDLTTATNENSEVIKISTEVELKKLDGEDKP